MGKTLAVVVLVLAAGVFSWIGAQDAKAHKLTFEDYIEIQQLYHTYARAIDLGEGEKFAATFIEDGEFTGGRAPGRGAELRTPAKGHDALFPYWRSQWNPAFYSKLVHPAGSGWHGEGLLLFAAL
jgi:hypothetical protein